MPVIPTRVDTRSDDFRANATHMQTLVADLTAKVRAAAAGGGDAARARHRERGKLLPRERIEALLDPGSPFLELSSLAACDMYEGQAPCAGPMLGLPLHR